MKFINGTNRQQLPLFASSIDDAIGQDNEIRLIDLFVDSLKLTEFGFALDFVENGRPAYHPSDLLKLYIYGYLNRMRSSRTLEKECGRNIEVMWLMKGLVPDHNTISNFRKDNPMARISPGYIPRSLGYLSSSIAPDRSDISPVR